MVTCDPGTVGVTEVCSVSVGGTVPGTVVGVAEVGTAVPRPIPGVLASAASTGPRVEVLFPVVCIVAVVAVVGAGTTRVVLLRDGTVLLPGVPGTVDVLLVPCVPVTGTVTGETVLGVTA